MLLRYFYDEKLAHASYLVGCQRTGEAAVIDPMRNIAPYVELAAKENMTIIGALETHIHADFVSGSRELADRFGTTLYVSDEGGKDWTYENVENISHQLLKDGDIFRIGNIEFEVLYTPGHTPESISFILTDIGGGATEPMGIFTGDFVFVGDVGRPDLLEKAAGMIGTSAVGAEAMYKSLERFKKLPDYLQVWPAHGAGSACGKALGAIPSSTVGYEKQFNWALRFDTDEGFSELLLDGQPEPPFYFAMMKHVNKVGIELIKNLPKVNAISSLKEIETLIEEGHQVVDTRTHAQFGEGHIRGTINIPLNNSFTNWSGWLVDYEKPLYVLGDPEKLEEVLIALRSIGIDHVLGYANVAEVIAEATDLQSYDTITPADAQPLIENDEVYLIDVRNQSEVDEGSIDKMVHIMLGTVLRRLAEVKTDKKIIVQCQAGGRSAIAASLLQANGIENVVNMLGGYSRWVSEVK